MLVQISPEGERNGRDDSDFYIQVFDLETLQARTHLVGSTRYANGACRYDGIATPSQLEGDTRAAFEGALWGYVIACAESAEISRIERPGPLFAEWLPPSGTRVRLSKAVRNRASVAGPCSKCAGSGKWINPRNDRDVRQCFGCAGTGQREEKRKGGGMVTIETGARGVVVSAAERRSQYGTYSYGATARIRLEDGRIINAPTSALHLDAQPDMKRAREDAKRRYAAYTTWSCPITHRTA